MASIATFCLYFYQFWTRECNSAVYKFIIPNIERYLYVNFGISVVFKFASVVCLRLALEEYENLSSNASYFISAIMMSLAPSSLLAPIYTYDHVNCMPRNFFLNQNLAEELCVLCLILSIAPLITYIMLPSNIKKCICCKRHVN